MSSAAIEISEPGTLLRRTPRAGRAQPADRAGRDLRVSRPQRRRQDDALPRCSPRLLPIQRGSVSVLGFDLRTQMQAVRQRIGVVFQAPSLDKKLTVAENLMHQGHLYGLSGRRLHERQDEMLGRLGARPIAATNWSKSFPADCAAASNWPRGCFTARGYCCWTSRARASIPAPAAICGTICSKSAATTASPSS